MAIANGHQVAAHARLVDGGWLELTAAAPASAHDADGGWPALRLNARLNGCARMTCRPDGGLAGLAVRAEMFVGGSPDRFAGDFETDLAAVPSGEAALFDGRVNALCADLCAAYEGACAAGPGTPFTADAGGGRLPADGEALVRLCGDAGWPAVSRDPEDIHVALDGLPAWYQAHLRRDGPSGLQIVVELTEGPVGSDASRAAIARLLLATGSHVRMVKGVAFARRGVEVAGLAASCEPPPLSPAALDRALSAIAVACGRSGREVRALQRDDLARLYLALRHPSAPPAGSRANPNPELEDTPCLELP